MITLHMPCAAPNCHHSLVLELPTTDNFTIYPSIIVSVVDQDLPQNLKAELREQMKAIPWVGRFYHTYAGGGGMFTAECFSIQCPDHKEAS